MKHAVAITAVCALSLSACSSEAVAPKSSTAVPSAVPASFINRVWRVAESTAVAQGTLYVFLSDGTLVITSTNTKPLLGTWKSSGAGGLTMIEESIPYRVEILELTETRFRIRSHNPGGAVEITLARADDVP